MTQWQYKVHEIRSPVHARQVEFEQQLNALGQEGWEIIAVDAAMVHGTSSGHAPWDNRLVWAKRKQTKIEEEKQNAEAEVRTTDEKSAGGDDSVAGTGRQLRVAEAVAAARAAVRSSQRAD